MTVKGKIENLMRSAESDATRTRAFTMAGLHFLLGFLMSALRVNGGAAPFGVAAVAQAGPGANGVCALAGAALGYLVTGGIEWGIKYAAACVLAFTAVFVLQDIRLSERDWFRPLCAGAVMLLAGILGSFSGALGLGAASLLVLVESILAATATYFFQEALSAQERTTESAELRREAAMAVLMACGLAALSGVRLFSVLSIGRMLALLVMMAVSFRGGAAPGAACGTIFGAVLDACSGGVPFYTMAYAGSGLCSGVFSKHGRLLFLGSFILSNALLVLCAWRWTARVDALFEVFAASVIFMLIPPTQLAKICGVLQPSIGAAGESGLRRYAARRVEGIAEAYGNICDVVRRAIEPVNDNDIAKVFDRTADVVCIKCKKKNECWNKSYMDTLDALNSASHVMTEQGRLEEENLPERFKNNCEHTTEFVAAVNGELRAMAYRQQYRARLEESRAAAWGQYSDFSDILHSLSQELGSMNGADPLAERRLVRYLRSRDVEADAAVFRDAGGRLRVVLESGRLRPLTEDPAYLDKLSGVMGVRLCRPQTAGEGRMVLLEAEPLAVSVGIAAMKKKGETVSGDRGTYFKTDAGVLCVILSDGMGTGKPAARESIEAIAILERFLRSGVEPATAMKILNSVMLLRNGDEWGFATVDLICIDLFSGEAGFYKYGAAPSYVKNGKTVRRVSGESMAAGLLGDGAMPDVVRMKLKPGSLAVIASDGVITGDDDAWLKEIMQNGDEKDTKALAREVLRRAEDEYGDADDMTVLAIRMEARA